MIFSWGTDTSIYYGNITEFPLMGKTISKMVDVLESVTIASPKEKGGSISIGSDDRLQVNIRGEF